MPPCPLLLRLWWCAIKIGKIPKIINVSIPNVMTFYSVNICNFRTQYGIGLAQTSNKGSWRHFGLLRVFFVSRFMPLPRVSSAWTCVCFANNKTFPKLNKLLFEGKINWRIISKLFWRPLLLRKRPSKPGPWWECELAKMSVVNHVCWKELTEQVGLHCYAVVTYPDELVLEPPPKKCSGSAYGHGLVL